MMKDRSTISKKLEDAIEEVLGCSGDLPHPKGYLFREKSLWNVDIYTVLGISQTTRKPISG
jgi:hypothetical protein